jgi:hypothetical protein
LRVLVSCAALAVLAHATIGVHAIHPRFHDRSPLGSGSEGRAAWVGLAPREARGHWAEHGEATCPICLFLACFAASPGEPASSIAAPPRGDDVVADPPELAPRLAPLGAASARAPPPATA